MSEMPQLLVLAILLLPCLVAGDWCGTESDPMLCAHGCCGDSCCLSTLQVVGIAVGALMMLLFLVSIIICICCMISKRSHRTGRMVPINNSNSVYVNSHSVPPPPQYSSYNSYPSASHPAGSGFSYNDPVYPPGMVSTQRAAQPPSYSSTGHPPPSYTPNWNSAKK